MTTYQYDVIVIGAGHAGTEAALAAARMGARVALLTTNLDTVGQMSCNPAIGGVAKGHIVREIDALGGAMGRAIDASGIQFRLLNRRKGPAMHGPRAQADKKAYQQQIKLIVESQSNLDLRQEIVDDLWTESGATQNGAAQNDAAQNGAAQNDATQNGATQNGAADNYAAGSGQHRICGVRVRGDAIYRAEAVILTTGTFLQAIMHTGLAKTAGGRAGEGTTQGISGALTRLGFRLARFKTGTPPRLNGRTIDYGPLERQDGDPRPEPFSFLTDSLDLEQLPCWIAQTNPAVHDLIRANLHRAPMYSGQINSSGPRYCPSIEDKVVRFAEKNHHQLFLEPEGRTTHEVYVNGVSTSLPRDVQDAMMREVRGLEHAQIMRYGYAVEYDFCPPDQLRPSLETKAVDGLYFAGQINGTTGYEEAGAQGLVAGANAALKLRGEAAMVLQRQQAYIGVLIDDLVTRGVDEPYRMFTSRAEHRLLLRQDNADRRLTALGHTVGLVDRARLDRLQRKQQQIDEATRLLKKNRTGQVTLDKYLRRPEATWQDVVQLLPQLSQFSREVAQQVETDTKYSGYVVRQQEQIDRQQRLANKSIPGNLDYTSVRHLRTEARQKLSQIRPITLAQAGRISGITPADVALLLAHLTRD